MPRGLILRAVDTHPVTPNQVVANNLRLARELRGMTQEEAARTLEPHLGIRWSRAVFSAAERSVAGKRVRQFTADEIVAFARAFRLPVAWFLLPPADWSVRPTEEAEEVLSAGAMVDLVLIAGAGMEETRERLASLVDDLPADQRGEVAGLIDEERLTAAIAMAAPIVGELGRWEEEVDRGQAALGHVRRLLQAFRASVARALEDVSRPDQEGGEDAVKGDER
jgi:hypothetical protein